MTESGLTSRVELTVSCTELINMDTFSKSDPQVIMFAMQNNLWKEQGRTEIIWDNLNPKFVKSFVLDYYFESMLRTNDFFIVFRNTKIQICGC